MSNEKREIRQEIQTDEKLRMTHHWFSGGDDSLQIDGAYSVGGNPNLYIDIKHKGTGLSKRYKVDIADISAQLANDFLS